jgi:hypothetical protein
MAEVKYTRICYPVNRDAEGNEWIEMPDGRLYCDHPVNHDAEEWTEMPDGSGWMRMHCPVNHNTSVRRVCCENSIIETEEDRRSHDDFCRVCGLDENLPLPFPEGWTDAVTYTDFIEKFVDIRQSDCTNGSYALVQLVYGSTDVEFSHTPSIKNPYGCLFESVDADTISLFQDFRHAENPDRIFSEEKILFLGIPRLGDLVTGITLAFPVESFSLYCQTIGTKYSAPEEVFTFGSPMKRGTYNFTLPIPMNSVAFVSLCMKFRISFKRMLEEGLQYEDVIPSINYAHLIVEKHNTFHTPNSYLPITIGMEGSPNTFLVVPEKNGIVPMYATLVANS